MERFEQKYIPEPNTGCWLWLGCCDDDGYAKFSVHGVVERAIRWVYRQLRGKIPREKQLDHVCRTRCCVNPDHLEPVTPRENTLRGESVPAQNARKTHCLRGHELAGNNLLPYERRRRVCRACRSHRRRNRG